MKAPVAGEQSSQIITTAELFPDGAAIEQLRGNQLLLWQGGQQQVASTVEYCGRSYAPATLGPHLEQALRLPTNTEECGSTDQLVADLRQELTAVGLDKDASLEVAIGIVANWVAGSVPGPLVINFWGAAGSETALLDLMGCVCRRPLRLAQPPVHELAMLPAGLAPTLILNRPSERALARLFATVSDPHTYLLSGGHVVHVNSPIVVSTSKPVLAIPALIVPLLPATQPQRRITNSEAQSIANSFQGRLLRYRLTQHLKVANSQFDVAGLCPDIRIVARVLGTAVDDSPGLQASMIDALRSFDEQYKAEQWQAPAAAVLETLLLLCHSKRPAAYVREITEVSNTLLENRGESVELSPRAVGEILRQELGLVARRHTLGYELGLDVDTQRRIHRHAVAGDVLQRIADCPRCQETVVAIPMENEATSGM